MQMGGRGLCHNLSPTVWHSGCGAGAHGIERQHTFFKWKNEDQWKNDDHTSYFNFIK